MGRLHRQIWPLTNPSPLLTERLTSMITELEYWQELDTIDALTELRFGLERKGII